MFHTFFVRLSSVLNKLTKFSALNEKDYLIFFSINALAPPIYSQFLNQSLLHISNTLFCSCLFLKVLFLLFSFYKH
jgi:hypothetical protein